MTPQDVSYTCPQCELALWQPIARLTCSTLGLYDDVRFPGRCLLVFHKHVEDFAALDSQDTLAFIEDAKRAARAIQAATKAPRINYAILGNAEPHLHFHLVPRLDAEDPVPGKSPWNHPDEATPLPAATREKLVAKIAAHIAGASAVSSIL